MSRIEENIEALVNYLGWGDPSAGVWFIGLEEAFAWSNPQNNPENALTEYKQLLKKNRSWDYERLTPEKRKELLPLWKNQRLRFRIAQICLAKAKALNISKIDTRSEEFCNFATQCIFNKGSGVFCANIYPIGKPQFTVVPSQYRDLFGVENIKAYREKRTAFARNRLERLELLRKEQKPKAIICHGKAEWKTFQEWLKLKPDSLKPIYSSKALMITETADRTRVILSHHLSWRISGDDLAKIVEFLPEWNSCS
jgi:hypothetical protein